MKNCTCTFLATLLVWTIVGCSGSGTEPEPPVTVVDYELFFSYGQHPGSLFYCYLLDNDSFQVIDSIRWDNRPLSIDMEVTSSGRYLLWIDHYAKLLHCFETSNWSKVATRQLLNVGNYLSVPTTDESMLAFDQSDGLVIADVPSLNDRYRDTMQTIYTQFSADGNCLYANPGGDGDRFLKYEIGLENLERTELTIKKLDGTAVFVRHLRSSADGSLLYLATGSFYGPFYFHIVDSDSFQTLLEFKVPFPLSFICEQPHRSKVYFGYYGIWEMWDQGTIYEVDLGTMTVSKFLESTDFPITNPLVPDFSPTDMLIEPNTDIAYIVNGGKEFSKPAGKVFVFNLSTKEVIHTIDLPGTFLTRLFLIKREFTKGK